MRLDLTIAGLVALMQIAMGYLAWDIAINPLRPHSAKKKRLYKRLFILCGVMAVAAALAASWRTAAQGDKIVGLLVDCVQIRQAPPQTNIERQTPGRPDLRGVRVEDLHLDGGRAVASIIFANVGSEEAIDVNAASLTAVGEATSPAPESAEKLYREFDEGQGGHVGSSVVLPGSAVSITSASPHLDAKQVTALTQKKLRVYFLDRVTYRSRYGVNYFAVYCAYLSGDQGQLTGCGANFR